MKGRMGAGFTEDEINEMRRCFHAGVPAEQLAARLGCSRRTIVGYYRQFRGYRISRYDYQKPRAPQGPKVMPDRFYHSNFEPG